MEFTRRGLFKMFAGAAAVSQLPAVTKSAPELENLDVVMQPHCIGTTAVPDAFYVQTPIIFKFRQVGMTTTITRGTILESSMIYEVSVPNPRMCAKLTNLGV